MRSRILLAFMAAFLSFAAQPAHAQSVRMTGISPADSAALIQLAAAADAEWNAADADGLAALWAPDGHNRIIGADADLRGREAIQRYFAASFANRPAGMRHRTLVEEAVMIAPGVAAVDGQVWVEREGSAAPLRHFIMHAIAVRTPEGWRMRMNRVHLVPAAPATASR
ncbi:MAG TPA: SgcJ/EcaC family oxidoreductase [Longimicrobium sp.]|uniref:SgcJ/EcaC family oxidoreductase n=1 Tax=Longimicrobium sp. TaxID=2029185 RepID=UPI002ED8189D